jgi:hypothetical protein
MLYIVEYRVVGSRCTGEYAVNAKNKRDAKRMIKAVDEDYVPSNVWNLKEYEEMYALTDVMTDHQIKTMNELKPGHLLWLGSGT